MNRISKAAGVALLMLLAIAPAAHSSPSRPIQLTPFYGWRWGGTVQDYYTGTKLHMDAAPSFGGVLSVATSQATWAEFTYDRQSSKVKVDPIYYPRGEIKMAIDHYMIGGTREAISMNPDIHPFVGGMMGWTHFSSPEGQFTGFDKFSMGVDLGVKIMPNPKMGFRLDGRGFVTLVSGGSSWYVGTGGGGAYWSGSALWQGEVTGGLVLNF